MKTFLSGLSFGGFLGGGGAPYSPSQARVGSVNGLSCIEMEVPGLSPRGAKKLFKLSLGSPKRGVDRMFVRRTGTSGALFYVDIEGRKSGGGCRIVVGREGGGKEETNLVESDFEAVAVNLEEYGIVLKPTQAEALRQGLPKTREGLQREPSTGSPVVVPKGQMNPRKYYASQVWVQRLGRTSTVEVDVPTLSRDNATKLLSKLSSLGGDERRRKLGSPGDQSELYVSVMGTQMEKGCRLELGLANKPVRAEHLSPLAAQLECLGVILNPTQMRQLGERLGDRFII
jgi:hypothetical protein